MASPTQPSLSELMAALPDDRQGTDAATDADATWQARLAQLAHRNIPTSAVGRASVLGGLQARLAMAYGAWWLRSWFQAADRREQNLLETHLAAALRTLETMSYLRGAVMKVGQTLADMPQLVPEQFVETLEQLHFQAPPMHYALLRELVYHELGGDPDDVFAAFDPQAFAAASLGQVHRGRTPDGRDVAIKIQYPGIARTIRSDMRTLSALYLPLRLSNDWPNLARQLECVRVGLERETDYLTEAEMLRRGAALFGEDDRIVVPRPLDGYTTRRVLTMEYLPGRTIDEFLAGDPSQAERDHFGTLICRAFHRLYYHRLLYIDPHPGNVLFYEDGRLGLLDFGNVQEVNDDDWEFLRASFDATHFGGDVRKFCQRSLMMTDAEAASQRGRVTIDRVVDMMDYYVLPHRQEEPFDYGDREVLQRGIDLFRAVARRRHVRQRPGNLFLHRCHFDNAGLLYRLRARVPVRQICREEVGAAGWGAI